MKRKLLIMVCGLFILCSAHVTAKNSKNTIKKLPYKASWESLRAHEEVPEWLHDAKFGIYLHWGVFNVPAYGSEWYPYYMYRNETDVQKHHIEKYGKDFDYHDFIKDFKAEQFDAKDWAKLFKSSGAGFAGPCAIHHDGFSLWDSEANPWNSMDMGPMRDVTGELIGALKDEGMKTIATFHHARNLQRNASKPHEWADKGSRAGYDSHFGYHPSLVTASTDADTAKMYGNMPAGKFHDYWFDLIKEVVDNYSPEIIWFDSWLNLIPENDREKMVAYFYNEAAKKGQEVTVGFKQKDIPIDVGIEDTEEGGKSDMSERVWMTDVTILDGSWSYVEGMEYKSPELVLRNMIDVWSKNGVVLLNVAPMANGIIPTEQRNILTSIGEWLDKYGEAVYGTRTFDIFGYGTADTGKGHFGGQSARVKYTAEDIRFTRSKDGKSVYMIFLGRPEPGSKITMGGMTPHRYESAISPKKVTLLGTDIELEYVESPIGAVLTIPDAPMDEMATVVKFELR